MRKCPECGDYHLNPIELCTACEEGVFTVRYQDRGEWVDVFPGLTGGYDWAAKVAASTWNRDGKTVTPDMMRIYKLGGIYEM